MISIIVPTCKRPGMLHRMLESLQDTTQGYELEVIVIVDDDLVSANVAMEHRCHIVEHSKNRRGALYCWNRGLQLATNTSPNDIIIPAGDDQVFHPDWLRYALESHQERLGGYGVVGMNDLAYNGNTQLATMFIFDRQFCKDYLGGVIAPPVYLYYCVDSEINAIAKELNRFYWDERSKVEHLHSAHGKRAVDDHDLERLNANMAEMDNRLFEERKARGFPKEWQPVI